MIKKEIQRRGLRTKIQSYWLVGGALLCAFLTANASAQTNNVVRGTVNDEKGAHVAGAEVRLISLAGIQVSKLSDDEGRFEFTQLSPGKYLVQAKAAGFSNFTSDEISLVRGGTTQLDIILRVATISESVTITASGTAQRATELSKVVAVVDDNEIQQKRELLLPETLRDTPGVRVQQQGSPGALTTLRIRGQRAFDTSVLLDGMRVRDAGDINGSAVSLLTDLTPVAMDRIEVLRGAGSSLYGTSAVGGVVNLISATAGDGWHFETGAEAGALASYREHFKTSGRHQAFGFNLGLNRIDVRHGVDNEDQYGNSAGNAKFQFKVSNAIVITANLYGTVANARLNDSPFALPAAFASKGFARAVAGVTFHPDFNNPDQGRRNRLLVGALRLTGEPNDKITYSLVYQRVSSHRRNYNGARVDPKFASLYPFGDFEFLNVNKGTTDNIEGRVSVRLGKANRATAGFEFERESLFQQSIPSFSAFNNTTDAQRTYAVFGQDQISLFDDRLQISAGARAQLFRINAADRPGFLAGVNTERSLTGDVSFAYFFRSSGTKLHAHVGNGFRAPSLFERFGAGIFPAAGLVRFGDPTLRAEQSVSVDGGLEQRLANDRVKLSATYFYTRLQRIIAFQSNFVVDPLGVGRFSGYVNQRGGLARGFESSIEALPTRSTSLRASYTHTNSDRAVTGRGLQPEYVIPKHVFSLLLNQRYKAFAFNFDLTRTGSYLAPIFENDFPFRTAELVFAGFTKADLFGSYERKVSDRATLVFFAGADNIFNQRYYENGFLAPRAVARAGVHLKF